MLSRYTTLFAFMFILFSKIGFGQTSGDTVKIETKNKEVLIINKQTVDNWDFEAEIEQKRNKKFGFELFYGTSGCFERINNNFYLTDPNSLASTNYLTSYHWGSNLAINLIQSENERFFLNTGFGFSISSLNFSSNVQVSTDQNTTFFYVDSTNLKWSKFSVHQIQIPLFSGFKIGNLSKNPIGIQFGGELALRTNAFSRVKSSQNNITKHIRKNKFNTPLIQFSPMLKICVGNIGFYGKVFLRPLFQAPLATYYTFSCGIIFANF